MLVRLDSICCPCYLTQITYQKPLFAGCYTFFQFFFFWGGAEKENPVQVKPGNNSESESPNLSLPHPQTEKPKMHVWHTCSTAAAKAGCSLMPQPSLVLQAMPFVTWLPLLLPCACQQAPSYAGAILSHFQTGFEGGLSQSRVQRVLQDGSHPQPILGACQQHPAWHVFSAP